METDMQHQKYGKTRTKFFIFILFYFEEEDE
jgi:hypothetical protein